MARTSGWIQEYRWLGVLLFMTAVLSAVVITSCGGGGGGGSAGGLCDQCGDDPDGPCMKSFEITVDDTNDRAPGCTESSKCTE